MQAEPFEIHVPENVLEDLYDRIGRTRWPDSIEDCGWEYGTDINVLRELAGYWRDHFDWRKEESRINSFPQYRLPVDGLRIHFVHLRSKNPDAAPLIITHGWPGSFLEMLKVAPMLQDSFHVVIPSIPGYGFSDASRQPGMNPKRVAALWVKLMEALGYERFFAQGGDWGAAISTWIALEAPQKLIGLHLNYIPGSYRPCFDQEDQLAAEEKEFLRQKEEWVRAEGAYGDIQGTKPQTLAYAMNDSPVGMAAWILEKARAWSDCGGNVLNSFTYDELLSNIMVYWITETLGSSIRLYYEARKTPLRFRPDQRVHVPCAVARFAKEAPMPPRAWVERGYNVVRWSEIPTGGHFAAMEAPEVLAKDILESAELMLSLSAGR